MVTPVFLSHPKSSVCLLVPGKEHVNFLLQLLNDQEIRDYLTVSMPISRIAEEKFIERCAEDKENIVLIVATADRKKPIGTMGLHRIDWKNRHATTGAALSPECRGQGYGSDAKMLFLHHAFRTLNLNKVVSHVYAFNERSQAYNRKCGYTECGRLRSHAFRNGTYVDEVIMEILSKDWHLLWRKFEKGRFHKKK
jgi:RimJ/RimL family protein N-acetyltransferase